MVLDTFVWLDQQNYIYTQKCFLLLLVFSATHYLFKETETFSLTSILYSY